MVATRRMRLVVYLLLVLVVIGYCCNAIPSNYNQFSVLLSSTEDIESGAVFSVATDTVINETLSHSIFLKHLNETIETDIVNNVSLTLTINKKETFHLDPETTKINLTHANNSLTKYGCNELRLQYNPTYTLHPKRELSDAHLLTISVSKYYHLYLFTSPVIQFDKNDSLLYCYLNNTGAKEYGNWLVKFTMESNQGTNVTVGVCVKDNTAQDSHNKTEIYYISAQNACVFKLPSPVLQSDVGNYTCSLHITHAETGSKTICCNGSVAVSSSHSKPRTVVLEVAIGVGVTALLAVLALLCGLIMMTIIRNVRHKPQPAVPPDLVTTDDDAPEIVPNRRRRRRRRLAGGGGGGDDVDSTADINHLESDLSGEINPRVDTEPDSLEGSNSPGVHQTLHRPRRPRAKSCGDVKKLVTDSSSDDEGSRKTLQPKRSSQRDGSKRRKKKKAADEKPANLHEP